ncbi:hypothetical protein DCAR_0310425 [Daucus carota subsp. sativus]|uniref:Uncharacterized protein n=1 Tax=Daucus carota subsp. sativus TaxID=79200 RepID=A0A165ZUZ0_DAUCS|nr:hypothetical protein DCAR_0310425 [Daucus carota subsp. sativus]
MALLSKTSGLWCTVHKEGDDDDAYTYVPCVRGGGDDDDGDYDYAPAASEGDDDDDGGYDYAPAA